MFPESELLQRLRVAIQEAEKSANAAQQLLNGKRQTRYTHSHSHSQTRHTLSLCHTPVVAVCAGIAQEEGNVRTR